MSNGYTRVRSVSGTKVTTHFVPTDPMPRRERFHRMEHKILRNLQTIQEFNLANYTGPISPDHARAQRQRYEIIRENCEVTNNLVTRALNLSDDTAVSARAFHGLFLTLKTMLANEVTRAETINLRAINYWHHHVIPDPPRHSPLNEQQCESAIARRMGLFVNLSSDTSSENETNDGSSPSYSPTSPPTPQ
jgi:hypothetical protein